MRKIVYSVGAVALLAVTFSAGIRVGQVGSQPRLASTDGFSRVEASALSVAMSPYELMVKHGRSLPAEQWSDPF